MSSAIDVDSVNLLAPETIEDPYPTWRALREADPVHEFEGLNAWILTRFEDVHNAFKDDRLSIDYETLQVNRMGPDVLAEPYCRVGSEMVVCKDPPDHTRLRRIFRKALTPKLASSLAGFAEEVATRCVERFADRGEAELTREYAAQVPVTMTSRMLGIPREDHEKIADLVHDFAPTMAPHPMSPEQLRRTNEVCEALLEYFGHHVDRKRESPGDDLTSALIAANAQDDAAVTREELLANMPFLYFAGQDTQTNLLGNIVVALDRNRDQLAWLLEDPSRVDECMHELLRYDTSGQLMGRTAREDVEIGGKTIPKGATVMLCMGAANRDPEQFSEPEKLDLQRPAGPSTQLNYISFGAGRHRCLGIHVAQTNVPITLRVLLERVPFDTLRVSYEDAVRCMDIQQRGYERLPIEWSAH